MNLVRRFFTLVAPVAALLSVASSDAQAASIIRNPNPPQYKVEIEPKLNLGFVGLWDYGGNSYGPGVRFSIPVMSPGFVKTINDSVAITFGADFVYYEGYRYYNRYCGGNRACYDYYRGYNSGFWSVQLPVALQWNFFLTDKWSVFGEAGLTVRHAFYRDDPYVNTYCDARYYDCSPSRWNVWGTFYGGGRFHFNEKIALTMRIGYPTEASVGVSFFL
jgi:hypothetical protein